MRLLATWALAIPVSGCVFTRQTECSLSCRETNFFYSCWLFASQTFLWSRGVWARLKPPVCSRLQLFSVWFRGGGLLQIYLPSLGGATSTRSLSLLTMTQIKFKYPQKSETSSWKFCLIRGQLYISFVIWFLLFHGSPLICVAIFGYADLI